MSLYLQHFFCIFPFDKVTVTDKDQKEKKILKTSIDVQNTSNFTFYFERFPLSTYLEVFQLKETLNLPGNFLNGIKIKKVKFSDKYQTYSFQIDFDGPKYSKIYNTEVQLTKIIINYNEMEFMELLKIIKTLKIDSIKSFENQKLKMEKMFKEMVEGRKLMSRYIAPVIIKELNLKREDQVFPMVSSKDSECYSLKETINLMDLSLLKEGYDFNESNFLKSMNENELKQLESLTLSDEFSTLDFSLICSISFEFCGIPLVLQKCTLKAGKYTFICKINEIGVEKSQITFTESNDGELSSNEFVTYDNCKPKSLHFLGSVKLKEIPSLYHEFPSTVISKTKYELSTSFQYSLKSSTCISYEINLNPILKMQIQSNSLVFIFIDHFVCFKLSDFQNGRIQKKIGKGTCKLVLSSIMLGDFETPFSKDEFIIKKAVLKLNSGFLQ
jgi:hypothetical protein